MAIHIGTQEEVEEYFASEALNQSTLKELQGGLGGLLSAQAKKKKQKEGPTPEHFIIGNGVDTILTGGKGDYEEQFYVSQLGKTPSLAEMQIVEYVFKEMLNSGSIQDIEFKDCEDSIIDAANEYEWQMRWKTPTRLSKLIEAGEAFFNDLKRAYGKQILSREQDEKIYSIVNSLKHNRRTRKYFCREDQEYFSQNNNGVVLDFYYQVPIYFTINGMECKALPDLVVTGSKNGELFFVEPIDLKTMAGNTFHFLSKVKQHRYDIQAAWYVEAILQKFKCDPAIVKNFKFIVESTTNPGTPLVFALTKDTIKHGKLGSPSGTFKDPETGREIFYSDTKGYIELLEDYEYYKLNDFQEERILMEDDVLDLDWNKGILQNNN